MNVKALAAFLFFLFAFGIVSAVTLPANIVVYVPINVINSQSVGTSNTFQQLVTVNSLLYKPYEAGNLMNVEFFYANSVVIPSWLESNNSNSSAVTNYWLSINGVAASSSELVYMGFAPLANDILSSTGSGQASQFVSNSFDTCNVVFPYCQEFSQNTIEGSLPTGVSKVGTPTLNFNAGNVQIITTDGSDYGITLVAPTSANTANYVLDAKLSQTPSTSLSSSDSEAGFGLGAGSQTRLFNGNPSFSSGDFAGAAPRCSLWVAGSSQSPYTTCANIALGLHVWSIFYQGMSANSVGTIDYNSLFAHGPIASATVPTNVFFTTNNGLFPMSVYWFRIRSAPPNDVMPSAVFQSPVVPLAVSISNPTNAIADVGQSECFTATITTTEQSPYTYNILVDNSVTVGIIAHNSLDSNTAATTNTLCYATTSADTTNSPEKAIAILTDSFPLTVNSAYSSTFTINPMLTLSAMTPTNPSIDLGQKLTLTANPSGGTPSYTYKWYSHSGPSTLCDPANVISGATSSTYIVKLTSTNSYAVNVTDGASTQASICSSSDTVMVSSVPSLNLVPTNTLLDILQTEKYTITASNGIGPFNSVLFNLTAWARGYMPFYQNANVLVYFGSSNQITYQTSSPTQVNLPSGWSIGNYIQISLTNIQYNSTSHHFEYIFTLNGSNYTQYTANDLRNVGFFYENGTKIDSFFEGNQSNPIQTGSNLNLAHNLVWVLNLTPSIPATNLSAYNVSLYNDTNHPSCVGDDASVPDPSAPHGLYIFNGFEGITRAQGYNTTTYQYISNDPRVCGILINLAWSTLEPTNGTYNWGYITNVSAPWIAAGKQVALSFYAGGNQSTVFYADGLSNTSTYGVKNEDTPKFVLLNSTVMNECTTTGTSIGLMPVPWQTYPKLMYEELISNVITHYANNSSISYIRFGLVGDTTGQPTGLIFNTSSQCTQNWISNGLTYNKWINYSISMLNYEGSLNSKKQLLIDTSGGWNNTAPYSLYSAVIGNAAVNDRIGLGTEGYDLGNGQYGYLTNQGCVDDWCNLYQQYKGLVPMWNQPSTENVLEIVDRGSPLGGQVNQTLAFGPYIGGQVLELWDIEFLLADDPTYSIALPNPYVKGTFNGHNFINYSNVHTTYSATFNAVANVLGWTNTSMVTTKPFYPNKTSLNIEIGFAPKTTNLFDGKVVGEDGVLSLAQSGSCSTNDNGANVFIYYQSFCGLSSLPSGWSTTAGGPTIIYTPSNVEIINPTGQQTNVFNGIYESSPLSANTAGYTLDAEIGATATLSSAGSSNYLILGFVHTPTSTPFDNFGAGFRSNFGFSTCTEISGGIIGVGFYDNCQNIIDGTHVWSISKTPISANFSVNYNQNIGTNTPLSNANPTYLTFQTQNTFYPQALYFIDTRISPPALANKYETSTLAQMPIERLSMSVTNVNSAGNSTYPGLLTQSPSRSVLSYEVLGTDTGSSGIPNLYNSSANTIIINTDPSTTLGTCGATFDSGQTCKMTISPVGGTYPQSCELFNVTGNKQQGANVLVYSSAMANTVAFTLHSSTSNNVFVFNSICTDSATTPETSNSAPISLTVNTAMSTPIISINNYTPSAPAAIYITTNLTGGTGPYTYNFVVSYLGNNTIFANQLNTGVLVTSNVMRLVIPPQYAGKSFYANVIVTDSSSTPQTVNSINSNTIVVQSNNPSGGGGSGGGSGTGTSTTTTTASTTSTITITATTTVSVYTPPPGSKSDLFHQFLAWDGQARYAPLAWILLPAGSPLSLQQLVSLSFTPIEFFGVVFFLSIIAAFVLKKHLRLLFGLAGVCFLFSFVAGALIFLNV